MIREFFQRRAIRRAFTRYLSPEVVDAVVSGQSNADVFRLNSGEIGYVLAWLRGASPDEISRRMGKAAEIANRSGGITDCMVSGLLVVCFGTLPLPLPDVQPHDRSGFVADLIQQFGENIKLVHGTARGHYGNLGGPERMAYSFILEAFEPALARLCALHFGQVEEYGSIQKGEY